MGRVFCRKDIGGKRYLYGKEYARTKGGSVWNMGEHKDNKMTEIESVLCMERMAVQKALLQN